MFNFTVCSMVAVTALLVVFSPVALAATEDLGNGFQHHGVATPVSNHRGTVATVDGDGRNVVLVWLFDHRGGYALLMIDAETGASEEIPMPFPPGGDCPYSSVLSSDNKFYTHFNSYFAEFDPAKRAFTFHHATTKQMTMGMTEDDDGVIWSVSYPNSGVVSFDPATREFKDYGSVHSENWAQYQRYVAADDTGWIYFGMGNTASQVFAFDPATGTATAMAPESERVTGSGYVYRDLDGKVYGHSGSDDNWYVFYKGEGTKIAKPEKHPKPIITSSQGLFHRDFPDGKRLITCDTVERVMVVEDPAADTSKTLDFDYTSEGAHIMGMAAAPDGTICGGTAFPMRFFSYDPVGDAWVNRKAYGQFNTVVRQGEKFFFGGYGGGFLLEWDPAQPWVAKVKKGTGQNPQFLTDCTPPIHRPHDLLAHPDGNTVVLAGTPGYGRTGGGLLFWDRATQTRTLVEHMNILPEHSTMSLAALPKGKILGGTTIGAGTGGEVKATQAELYIMDMETKKVDWHEAVLPGLRSYTDLAFAANGLVYGVADTKTFFVFDAAKRKLVHQENLEDSHGSTISHQGPRVFVTSPEGTLYMLFRKGIAQVDQKSHAITMLAESPVKIGPGGDYHKGRIYFGSGSHMYSYELP
jgi:hypothetical protein